MTSPVSERADPAVLQRIGGLLWHRDAPVVGAPDDGSLTKPDVRSLRLNALPERTDEHRRCQEYEHDQSCRGSLQTRRYRSAGYPVDGRERKKNPAVWPYESGAEERQRCSHIPPPGPFCRPVHEPRREDDKRDIEGISQDEHVPSRDVDIDGETRCRQHARGTAGELAAQII